LRYASNSEQTANFSWLNIREPLKTLGGVKVKAKAKAKAKEKDIEEQTRNFASRGPFCRRIRRLRG
jgi:hypothetical protein